MAPIGKLSRQGCVFWLGSCGGREKAMPEGYDDCSANSNLPTLELVPEGFDGIVNQRASKPQ